MEGEEGQVATRSPGAENVSSDATEPPVEGDASAEEEAQTKAAEAEKAAAEEKKAAEEEKAKKAAEEDELAKKLADEEKLRQEMDAVVTETIPVASSSPSLEKWDSFDIIADLVDQVDLLNANVENMFSHVLTGSHLKKGTVFFCVLLLSENLEIVCFRKIIFNLSKLKLCGAGESRDCKATSRTVHTGTGGPGL